MDLYEKLVAPIFLYSCEVWGAYTNPIHKTIGSNDMNSYFNIGFEKMYLSFLKYCLGVNRKACNFAVISELGAYPYTLKILTRICKNWHRIINLEKDTLLYDCYLCNYELERKNNSEWVAIVKTILNGVHCTELWENCGRNAFITKKMNKALQNSFVQQWEKHRLSQCGPDKKLRT